MEPPLGESVISEADLRKESESRMRELQLALNEIKEHRYAFQNYASSEQRSHETSIKKSPSDGGPVDSFEKSLDQPKAYEPSLFQPSISYDQSLENPDRTKEGEASIRDLMEKINKLLELHQYQSLPFHFVSKTEAAVDLSSLLSTLRTILDDLSKRTKSLRDALEQSDRQSSSKVLDEVERLRRERERLIAQLDQYRSKVIETDKTEQELKTKYAKNEQSLEKSLRTLREKLKQQENITKIKESEGDLLKTKVKALEKDKDQLLTELTKLRKGGKEREWEIRLAEREREIRKLQAELIESQKQINELEYREKEHAEAYTGSALQMKEDEIEDLKRKNADLVAMKMKLIRDNNELKDTLNESAGKLLRLEKDKDMMQHKLESAPKEFQYELQRLKEGLAYYQQQSQKLTEENSQLEEEVMHLRNQANSHLFKKSPLIEHFSGGSSQKGKMENIGGGNWVTPEGALLLADEANFAIGYQK